MKHCSSFMLVGALGCLAAGLAGCDTNPLAPAREHPAALFSRGGSKPPSNTSARPENSSSVEISWTDNSSNEDGFHVERSTNGGANWTTVYRTGPNQTRTFDSDRSAESPELCYRVSAFNRNGDSAPSNTDCATPPARPTNFTASAQDDQAIALTWTDNSAVEDGYEVQRALSYIGPYTVIANLPANAASYRDASDYRDSVLNPSTQELA